MLALRRLKWLLVTVFIAHLGFAPDRVAAFGGSVWLPAPAAWQAAIEQAGLLVVLLAGVELLRQTTSPRDVAAAIVMLLAPLRAVGVDTRRFAVRLALTMEAVPACGHWLSEYVRNRRDRGRGFAAWTDAAADLVRATEARAADTDAGAALPELRPVGALDWLVLLAALLMGTFLIKLSSIIGV